MEGNEVSKIRVMWGGAFKGEVASVGRIVRKVQYSLSGMSKECQVMKSESYG